MKVFDRIFGKKYEKEIERLKDDLAISLDDREELLSMIKTLKLELQLQRVLIGSLRDVNKSLDERLIAQEGAQ